MRNKELNVNVETGLVPVSRMRKNETPTRGVSTGTLFPGFLALAGWVILLYN
jgi:hypothetical protein